MREHRDFTYIWLFVLGALLSSCVAKPGNIRRLIDLPNTARQPTRPQAPAQPEKFPPVSLVWERVQQEQSAVAWNIEPAKHASLKAGPNTAQDSTPASKLLGAHEPLLQAPQAEAAVGRNIGPFWLPPLPQNGPERKFDRRVHRVLKTLVDKGRDESASLLALAEQLESDSRLENLRVLWLPTLKAARNYAKVTSHLREPLHLLRRAFRKARFDEYYGVYRDIDIASCRWAARRSIELLPPQYDQSFEVVIRGLGRHSLSSIATLCEQSLAVALSEQEFPQIKGRRNLRRLVQRTYEKAHPDYKIHQTSVPAAWQPDGNGFLLRAVMGIERDSDFPHTQCSIEEIELTARNRRALQKPECCEIIRSLPIKCEELQ